jgi:hypothetical protein
MTAAALLAIRTAPALDEYPPLRLVRALEAELLPVVRGEACACGGWLTQRLRDDPRDVVAAHITTPAHRAWRAEQET